MCRATILKADFVWWAISFKIMTQYTCSFLPRILAIFSALWGFSQLGVHLFSCVRSMQTYAKQTRIYLRTTHIYDGPQGTRCKKIRVAANKNRTLQTKKTGGLQTKKETIANKRGNRCKPKRKNRKEGKRSCRIFEPQCRIVKLYC